MNSRPKVGLGVVIYDKQNNLILMSKRKDNNLYALPGGHLEMFETYQTCAQREVKEETSLNLEIDKIKLLNIYNVFRKEINYHYLAIYMVCQRPLEQEVKNPESHKHEDWTWFTAEQIEQIKKDQLLFHSLENAFEDAGGVKQFFQMVHDIL